MAMRWPLASVWDVCQANSQIVRGRPVSPQNSSYKIKGNTNQGTQTRKSRPHSSSSTEVYKNVCLGCFPYLLPLRALTYTSCPCSEFLLLILIVTVHARLCLKLSNAKPHPGSTPAPWERYGFVILPSASLSPRHGCGWVTSSPPIQPHAMSFSLSCPPPAASIPTHACGSVFPFP